MHRRICNAIDLEPGDFEVSQLVLMLVIEVVIEVLTRLVLPEVDSLVG